MDDRDPVPHRGVVQEVARREVVGAVDDDLPALVEDPVDVVGAQALSVRDDLDVRVQLANSPLGRLDLWLPERGRRMQHLALEVRLVDCVVVHDPESADPCGGEVERGRRAEPARTDDEHVRGEQPLLARDADLRDQDVPAVPDALCLVETAGRLDGETRLGPGHDPARERDDVLEAVLVHRLGQP